MCLPHVRRAKVKFVSESDAATALAFIPPDVLPATFGGAAPPLPVDEAVRKFGLAKPAQLAGPGKARPHRCPAFRAFWVKNPNPLPAVTACRRRPLPAASGGAHLQWPCAGTAMAVSDTCDLCKCSGSVAVVARALQWVAGQLRQLTPDLWCWGAGACG